MKKILALALALVMMFAVCVPAFAVTTITDNAPEIIDGKQTAPSLLKTSMQKEDGSEGATYTVTIPAETIIPWEKELPLFSYSVVTQLESGKRLAISAVSQSGKNELVDATGEHKIAYSFSKTNGGDPVDSLSYTTESEVVNTNRTFNIVIPKTEWQKVPVNEYTSYLTFTVQVVDA